jgi:hypothetical protein
MNEVTWTQLKSFTGIWGYSEDNKEYFVFKDDAKRRHGLFFDKSEYQTVGTDCKDFYDNYKTDIDNGVYHIENRRNDLKQIVHVSERETGMFFNWTSFYDNVGVQDGVPIKIVFDGSDQSNPKKVSGTFTETIKMPEGTIFWKDLPVDSVVKFSAYCPNNGYYYKNSVTNKPCPLDHPNAIPAMNTTGDWLLIGSFCNVILEGTNTSTGYVFQNKDLTTFPLGYKLELEVCSGDPAQQSRVTGNIKVCREALV